MRWFQRSISLFVEPFLMGPFPWCLHILKMTILPLPVNSPSERELFPANLSAIVSHLFPEYLSTPRQANLLSWARTCVLTLLAPHVCVVPSALIVFVCSYSVMFIMHACVLMISFSMLIRMLLLILPCHYSTLFSCHRYKMLWWL